MPERVAARRQPPLAVWSASAIISAAAVALLFSGGQPLQHVHGATYLAVFAMWAAMAIAMMLPIVTPWLTVLAAFDERGRTGTAGAFGAGYIGVWILYAVGAAAVQVWLARSSWLAPHGTPLPWVAAVVFTAAGIYQFSGLKAACLAHCRSPLSYLIAQWNDGPPSGWALGMRHGLFCLGCCWALMAVTLAVGAMDLAWMAVIMLVVCLEQLTSHGKRISRWVGVGLIVAGVGHVMSIP